MSGVLSAVKLYHSLGWVTVPLHYGTKDRPLTKAWQEPLTIEAAERAFKSGQLNVAIHLGAHSKWLVDIDLDCPEALTLAREFLPPTVTVGRRSSRESHWLYQLTGPIDTKKFKDSTMPPEDDKRAMIAEIRATNHYTVFPPSQHPSGEFYEFTAPFDGTVPPTSIDPVTLRKSVGRLAACVIVVRNWPTGARHEASLALAGGLSRCGLTDEEVLAFIAAACDFNDDEEKVGRLRAAKDTLKKLHAGRKKVSGFPALAEVMGEEPVEAIRSFLVDDEDGTVLEDFNKEFKYVQMQTGDVVLHLMDVPGLKKQRIDYLSVSSFKERVMDRYITLGKGDAIKTMNLGKYWLTSPHAKRKYVGLTFDPSGAADGSLFNTWRGFSVDPVPGDCSLFLAHVRDVICSGNDEWCHWVMSFLAHAFQKPAEKKPACLVLRGEEGTGKSKFCLVLRSLIRDHTSIVNSPHQLVGKFNSHMQDCLLLIAEEAFFPGDKQHVGVLKDIISGEVVSIERKGKDRFEIPNYARLIMVSNDPRVVPAGAFSRRFGVFEVSDVHRKDGPYFAAIDHQMNDGGREALLHHLLNYKYDPDFELHTPENKAIEDQRDLSRSPVDSWWEERLLEADPCPHAGGWARKGHNGVDTWPDMASKKALWKDFEMTKKPGSFFNESMFWNEFWAMVPKTDDGRGSMLRTFPMRYAGEPETSGPVRMAFTRLPCLEDARREYCQKKNKRIIWPDVKVRLKDEDASDAARRSDNDDY